MHHAISLSAQVLSAAAEYSQAADSQLLILTESVHHRSESGPNADSRACDQLVGSRQLCQLIFTWVHDKTTCDLRQHW